ncbi:MAG: hypothetical protein ABRQ38_12270 [Candidatus Eremiobacterota bacterium]
MIINSSVPLSTTVVKQNKREMPSDILPGDRVTISGDRETSNMNPLELFAVNCVKDRTSQDMELSSREYKILLKPENFEDMEKGISKFWKTVKKLAKEEGFDVDSTYSDEAGDPRFVTYLDTPDFALNKLGYTLRRRQKHEFKAGEDRGKKYELTLKYRNSDVNISSGKDVNPAESFEGSVKFEDDIVAGGSTIKNVYSKSGTVELKEETGNSLEDYIDIFPGLKETGISSESQLGKVNNKKIEEYKAELGEIDFGGVTGKASLSVWYNQGKDKNPVIGEFSFNYDINDSENKDKINNFVKAIQRELSSSIADGITKTELIYGKKGEK